jgi:hypothetical protein
MGRPDAIPTAPPELKGYGTSGTEHTYTGAPGISTAEPVEELSK